MLQAGGPHPASEDHELAQADGEACAAALQPASASGAGGVERGGSLNLKTRRAPSLRCHSEVSAQRAAEESQKRVATGRHFSIRKVTACGIVARDGSVRVLK